MAPLLIVLALLAGVGFYNYQRNEALDQELQNRPHASLSTRDVDVLYDAHKSELEKLERKLGAQSDGSKEMGNYAPSDLKGKLQGFDRFQTRNKAWKELYREKLDQELALEAIEKERSIRRQGLDRRWAQVLRRVTTF